MACGPWAERGISSSPMDCSIFTSRPTHPSNTKGRLACEGCARGPWICSLRRSSEGDRKEPFHRAATVSGRQPVLAGAVRGNWLIGALRPLGQRPAHRSRRTEEHTSSLKSLMRIHYAVFFLNKKNITDK